MKTFNIKIGEPISSDNALERFYPYVNDHSFEEVDKYILGPCKYVYESWDTPWSSATIWRYSQYKILYASCLGIYKNKEVLKLSLKLKENLNEADVFVFPIREIEKALNNQKY